MKEIIVLTEYFCWFVVISSGLCAVCYFYKERIVKNCENCNQKNCYMDECYMKYEQWEPK